MPRQEPPVEGTVRVHGYDFQIVRAPQEEMAEVYGDCDLDNLRIRVAEGMPPDLAADVAWHELGHAVEAAAGVEGLSEEEFTRFMRMLYVTIRQNPDYFQPILFGP